MGKKYLKKEIEEGVNEIAAWLLILGWRHGASEGGANHLTLSLTAACEPRKCPTTPFGQFIHCIQKETIVFL